MSTEKSEGNNGRDEAMIREKDLMAMYYEKVNRARDEGKKICYTFIPGGFIELLHTLDVVPVFPEVLGLQMGMRKISTQYIESAENDGYSEDICSYVKSSVGMFLKDNIGPYGREIPKPDFLFLISSQCFTFMKWWEILRNLFDCPIITIHLPYRHHGKTTADEIRYGVKQFEKVVIPQFEEITGNKFDMDKLKGKLALSRKMEEDLAWAFQAAKNTPCPVDGLFQALYYVGPINTYFRGTQEGVDFYKTVRKVVKRRVDAKQGPPTPFGRMDKQNYRLAVECAITWDHFREHNKIFFDEGAITVASTYTKVAGLYDTMEFSHDPNRPFESMIEQNMTNYCNNSLEDRVRIMEGYIRDYSADGFLIGSIKSCKSFAAGQLAMLRELEDRTGIPGAFYELDMMDSRYFSEANVRTRIESYFRMIDENRKGKQQ